jgi:hypothetical protein
MGILTDLFDSWKEALHIFKPETVIRWHRQSFRVFWKWKGRSTPGRPAIPQARINLIKQMANDNSLLMRCVRDTKESVAALLPAWADRHPCSSTGTNRPPSKNLYTFPSSLGR